jgi:ABC-type amino acid transport substrate-binding protein
MLRIATSGDYPPFSSESKNGYHGFDIELSQLIAGKLGLGVQFMGFSWTDFEALLQSSLDANPAFDMIASGVTVTSARRSLGLYSEAYLRNRAILIGPRESHLRSTIDDPRLRIGVNKGGYLEGVVRREFPHHIVVTTDNNRELANLIGAGADCIVTDAIEGKILSRANPLSAWRELERHDIALFLPRSRLQLCAEVDAVINTARKDGTLQAIADRFGIDAELIA